LISKTLNPNYSTFEWKQNYTLSLKEFHFLSPILQFFFGLQGKKRDKLEGQPLRLPWISIQSSLHGINVFPAERFGQPYSAKTEL
jgi:hypothetical protein